MQTSNLKAIFLCHQKIQAEIYFYEGLSGTCPNEYCQQDRVNRHCISEPQCLSTIKVDTSSNRAYTDSVSYKYTSICTGSCQYFEGGLQFIRLHLSFMSFLKHKNNTFLTYVH